MGNDATHAPDALAAGMPDPLVNKPRVWATLDGFERWARAGLWRYPVTPRMLRWIKEHLSRLGYCMHV